MFRGQGTRYCGGKGRLEIKADTAAFVWRQSHRRHLSLNQYESTSELVRHGHQCPSLEIARSLLKTECQGSKYVAD